MSQDYSSKEAFEQSMSGYHKEAPAYLKKKSSELRTKALDKKRNKYYVGVNGESGKREAFGSKETPTKESHPQYGHVRSGFKTKKQAENEKHYY
jgi:hypothetical protein